MGGKIHFQFSLLGRIKSLSKFESREGEGGTTAKNRKKETQ